MTKETFNQAVGCLWLLFLGGVYTIRESLPPAGPPQQFFAYAIAITALYAGIVRHFRRSDADEAVPAGTKTALVTLVEYHVIIATLLVSYLWLLIAWLDGFVALGFWLLAAAITAFCLPKFVERVRKWQELTEDEIVERVLVKTLDYAVIVCVLMLGLGCLSLFHFQHETAASKDFSGLCLRLVPAAAGTVVLTLIYEYGVSRTVYRGYQLARLWSRCREKRSTWIWLLAGMAYLDGLVGFLFWLAAYPKLTDPLLFLILMFWFLIPVVAIPCALKRCKWRWLRVSIVAALSVGLIFAAALVPGPFNRWLMGGVAAAAFISLIKWAAVLTPPLPLS